MFGAGYRTPMKGGQVSVDSNLLKPVSPGESVQEETLSSEAQIEKTSLTKVRRSIGEWETGKTGLNSNLPDLGSPTKEVKVGPSKQKVKVALSQGSIVMARGSLTIPTTGALETEIVRPRGRVAEAKACLVKAKLQINSSRNLKAEIRADVILAVERLYRLVKEAEEAKHPNPPSASKAAEKTKELMARKKKEDEDGERDLARELEEHGKLMQENTAALARLKKQIEDMEVRGPVTYASVAATVTSQPVHSIVVSSADTDDTSEDVIEKIRTAVDAKASGFRVDRLRKAREGKVVLGCRSKDELANIAEKLKREQPALQIEQKENKDPLVIMKNVLAVNTDDDIIAALRRQNIHALGEIPQGEYRAVVRYRRRARNPHECHVVLRVSPRVWKCLTTVGKVHIDLQRVQVCDQSPLLQCTKCLAYGHGKKSCTEAADLCSHCTGPHMRKDCSHWKAGEQPVCRNCVSAKLDKIHHNCFDSECPTRKKWDRLVRTNVAYC